MRPRMLALIYKKEMVDLLRDRRTIISMVAVPVLVIPLLMMLMGKMIGNLEKKSEEEAKSMAVGYRSLSAPTLAALRGSGIQLLEKSDLKKAVEAKEVSAAIEEIAGPAGRPAITVYADDSNPTSSAASGKIRFALDAFRDAQVKESLRKSGISESVLRPFDVNRVNLAPARKMAGLVWGGALGYVLLLMMFTGGMYPVIDMTAGEKERKTLEPFLATPVGRGEIVVGKTLAGITAILTTAILTMTSMVVSLKGNTFGGTKSPEFSKAMSSIPLDPQTLGLIALTIIPMAVLAASLMIAIAVFARSFKEAQSYLTPLALIVIFPAVTSMLPGMKLSLGIVSYPS